MNRQQKIELNGLEKNPSRDTPQFGQTNEKGLKWPLEYHVERYTVKP